MKAKKILVLAALLALAALAAVLAWAGVGGQQGGRVQMDPDAQPKTTQNMTPEEWQAYLQEQADASRLRFQVNSVIAVEPDGKADLLLKNAAENQSNLQAVLTLEDGTELYRSGVLPPGGQELLVELTQCPDPGEHSATVTVQALDPQSGAVTGQAETAVKLQVKEVRPSSS